MKYRIVQDFRYNIPVYAAQHKFLNLFWLTYRHERCGDYRCISEEPSEVEMFIKEKIKSSKKKLLVVKTFQTAKEDNRSVWWSL